MLQDSALLLDVCEELLRAGRRARFRVEGTSMWPAIQAGDTVEVAPVCGSVREGSLLLFRGAHGPIVHRVVGRQVDGLITRGDAAAGPDPLVSPAQVVGQVVRVYAAASGTARKLTPYGMVKARWWLRSQKRALRCVRLPLSTGW